MTLEELGWEYLSQADEILVQINKQKEKIKKREYEKSFYDIEISKLMTLREIRDELITTGWKLVNYYKEG